MSQSSSVVNKRHTNSIRSAIDLSKERFGCFEDDNNSDKSYEPPLSAELVIQSQRVWTAETIERDLNPFYKRLASNTPAPKKAQDGHNAGTSKNKPYTDKEDAIVLAGKCPHGRKMTSVLKRRKLLLEKAKENQ